MRTILGPIMRLDRQASTAHEFKLSNNDLFVCVCVCVSVSAHVCGQTHLHRISVFTLPFEKLLTFCLIGSCQDELALNYFLSVQFILQRYRDKQGN